MATPNPKAKEENRSRTVPLMIVAGILVLIGIIMLVSNKVQSSDPTLTAAPRTGTPGQVLPHASASKMAVEEKVMAQQKAAMESFKSANH